MRRTTLLRPVTQSWGWCRQQAYSRMALASAVARMCDGGAEPRHRSSWEHVISSSNLIKSNGWRPLATAASVAAVAGILASAQQDNECNSDAESRNPISISPLTSKTTLMESQPSDDNEDDGTTLMLNWSGTHSVNVQNNHFFEPETIPQVEAIVQKCHKQGQPMRPIGAALSPNAIGFRQSGMIGLAGLDEIVSVDTEAQTVTVQAGARVSQVVDALAEYNLTLPNLASIAEQQMGGFVQVGAHGTGRCIAPVDHYVTQLKLVTPGRGTITLTEEDGELFHLAKVGLGCLGVVVEVTMKCIPAHKLVEHTFVLSYKEAKEQAVELLEKHKHMRYMWIPYTDTVVVVTNDPEDSFDSETDWKKDADATPKFSDDERFQPLRELLLELTKEQKEKEDAWSMDNNDSNAGEKQPITEESLQGMGFGELRDALLAFDPLDVEHVKRCNRAEAEFWKRSQGYQVRPSHELLQFDCGGQQWVLETCFPTGKQEKNNGNDMQFMQDLLEGIERENIPAPAPIEQRWSASSSSIMSPAHDGTLNGLHCWVGIIYYLPTEDESQRRSITNEFTGTYSDLMRSVGGPYGATSHWAKLEQPKSLWKLVDLKLHYQQKFPLSKFNSVRAWLDPKNLMANDLLNQVLGVPP